MHPPLADENRVSTMNPVTVGIGTIAILYGLFTAYLRATNPSSFKKLDAMKKMWGDKGGMMVHVIAYTVVPIVAGAVLLVCGFMGISFAG